MTEFRGWMFDMASDDNDRRANAYVQVTAAMGELIREREAGRKDDLISKLMDADIDGRPPTFAENQNYGMLLFTAGLDTLVNSFTFGIFQLARQPELQQRIKADRSLIPALIEELLRRYAIAMPPRIVMHDAEFGGVRLKAGDRVVMMLPAGNLDPSTFDDPLRFDIDREEVPHLTFNSGPHRCVGSHLARLELRVFFEEWFRAMPTVRLDPDQAPLYRPGLNLAIVKLPIVWDA
jgi:cytochrome P450